MFKDKNSKNKDNKDSDQTNQDSMFNESPSHELSLMEKAELYTDNETAEDYQLDYPLSEPIFRLSLLQPLSERVMNRETGELDLKPGWFGSQDDSFLNPLREYLIGEIIFFTLTQDRYNGEYVRGNRAICHAGDGLHGIGDPGGECRSCTFYRSECKGGLRILLSLHLDEYEQREYNFDQYPVVVRFASKGILPLQRLIRTIVRERKRPVARVTIKITSEWTKDLQGRQFYVPVFTPIDILNSEQWAIIKAEKAKLMETMIPEIVKISWDLDDADVMNALSGNTENSTDFNYGANVEDEHPLS